MSDFDKAFELVVGVEGGYVNDPNDPGGETIYGITRRDHPDLWVGGPPTLAQAKGRYMRDYWAPLSCGDMPWPLGALVFDAAVNQGVKKAAVTLQKALRVKQDGRIGPVTLAAARAAFSRPEYRRELLARFMALRGLSYVGTRNFNLYGEGWFWRLFHLAFSVGG